MTTPLEIEILIHYYTCASDYRNLEAPAIMSAIEGFVSIGLLFRSTDDDKKFVANYDALKPYVEALRQVPLPKQKWVV